MAAARGGSRRCDAPQVTVALQLAPALVGGGDGLVFARQQQIRRQLTLCLQRRRTRRREQRRLRAGRARRSGFGVGRRRLIGFGEKAGGALQ